MAPELQRLNAGHAPAVLAFELANRGYFAASISDRGDDFFDQFTSRHSALLAEQEAGTGAFYVLVAEDGSVLGRFNLVGFEDGTAELGYRVATPPAAAWRPQPSGSCAGWRRRGTGCTHSRRPSPEIMPHPSGCWPRPGSSRSARLTRLTSVVSKELVLAPPNGESRPQCGSRFP